MSAADEFNNGGLIAARGGSLAPIAGPNPLVARGVKALAKIAGRADETSSTETQTQSAPESLASVLERGKGQGYLTLWDLTEYLPEDPVDSERLSRLAVALKESGIRLLTHEGGEAVRPDSESPCFYYHRSRIWLASFKTTSIKKAINASEEAIRLDPGYAKAYDGRADARRLQEDYQNALIDHETAIRLDPNDAGLFSSYAHFLCGCKDANVRDTSRAIALATRACELTNWKRTDELLTLAVAYSENGQFDEAVRYQRKALEAEQQSAKRNSSG